MSPDDSSSESQFERPLIEKPQTHPRRDRALLIDGIPPVQIELTAHRITPRRAVKQIIDY